VAWLSLELAENFTLLVTVLRPAIVPSSSFTSTLSKKAWSTLHRKLRITLFDTMIFSFFVYFFGGLECVSHFAYVAYFCIFEKCLDSNQRVALASRCAANLATLLDIVFSLSIQKT
jgi:hypothetical protein